jgi:hypothetical protein
MRRITTFLTLIVVAAIAGASAPLRPVLLGGWAVARAAGERRGAGEGDPPVEWAADKNIKWKAEIPGKGSATPIV